MKNTYLRRIVLLLALFCMTVLPGKAEAAYQKTTGSSSPIDARYVAPGKWNDFLREDDGVTESFYYTASKKAGTYYWAHVNVQFPKAENTNPG